MTRRRTSPPRYALTNIPPMWALPWQSAAETRRFFLARATIAMKRHAARQEGIWP